MVVSFFTQARTSAEIKGLTLWSMARERGKTADGLRGKRTPLKCAAVPLSPKEHQNLADTLEAESQGGDPEKETEYLVLPKDDLESLGAKPGDEIFVDDARWWLGGLRSARCQIVESNTAKRQVCLSPSAMERNAWKPGHPVVLRFLD